MDPRDVMVQITQIIDRRAEGGPAGRISSSEALYLIDSLTRAALGLRLPAVGAESNQLQRSA
jgi:hypothetical protein